MKVQVQAQIPLLLDEVEQLIKIMATIIKQKVVFLNWV